MKDRTPFWIVLLGLTFPFWMSALVFFVGAWLTGKPLFPA